MNLTNRIFKTEYRSPQDDVVRDVFIPALSESDEQAKKAPFNYWSHATRNI